MIFTKESLKQSIKPIIIVILVCAAVFFWGRYRKVSVELTLLPAIESGEQAQQLDVTIFDEENAVNATVFRRMDGAGSATQHMELRPGPHFIRGSLVLQSGRTVVIEQSFEVPNDNAEIDLYLRHK